MKRTAITLADCTHHGTPVVSLRFEKDYGRISKVKTLKGARWSQSQAYWYISLSDFKLSEVLERLSSVADLDYSAIEKENTATQKGEIGNSEDSSSNRTIKKNAPQAVDVLCNEKEKTFYLTLPFALKEQFKKLEGAWWHPKLKQWSALDNEENRKQLKALLQQTGLNPEFIIAGLKKQWKIKTPNLENPVMPDEKFIRHMQLENKAKSTIKQYAWYVKWFLTVNRGKSPTKTQAKRCNVFYTMKC